MVYASPVFPQVKWTESGASEPVCTVESLREMTKHAVCWALPQTQEAVPAGCSLGMHVFKQASLDESPSGRPALDTTLLKKTQPLLFQLKWAKTNSAPSLSHYSVRAS